MEEFEDPIQAVFEQARKDAKQRVGKVPALQGDAPQVRRGLQQADSSTKEPRKQVSRGRPRGRDGRYQKPDRMQPLAGILSQEIKRRGWTREFSSAWIEHHWSELVGENIARHTTIEMIKDKTVFITCDSTAWATNLRLMQREILQAIARNTGPDIVTQLKIFGPRAPSWRHGPLHVKGRGPRDTYG